MVRNIEDEPHSYLWKKNVNCLYEYEFYDMDNKRTLQVLGFDHKYFPYCNDWEIWDEEQQKFRKWTVSFASPRTWIMYLSYMRQCIYVKEVK